MTSGYECTFTYSGSISAVDETFCVLVGIIKDAVVDAVMDDGAIVVAGKAEAVVVVLVGAAVVMVITESSAVVDAGLGVVGLIVVVFVAMMVVAFVVDVDESLTTRPTNSTRARFDRTSGAANGALYTDNL